MSDEWTFFYYPLDEPESPNGGWVGLPEIVAVDETTLAVIERDNQGGPDAALKKIYAFSVDGLEPQPQGGIFLVVEKSLVRDILPDLQGGSALDSRSARSFNAQTLQSAVDSPGEKAYKGRRNKMRELGTTGLRGWRARHRPLEPDLGNASVGMCRKYWQVAG